MRKIKENHHINQVFINRKTLNRAITLLALVFLIIILCYMTGCKKLIDVDPPRTSLVSATVFTDSASTRAAVGGIYNSLYNSFSRDQPYGAGISFLNGLYTDEILSSAYPQFQESTLITTDASVQAIWADSYSAIYQANAVIEGVQSSTRLSPSFKLRITAEAKFLRAFCHFYLVNTFNNIPLITSSSLSITGVAPQSTPAVVYQQIISDLKDAAADLPADYSNAGGARTHANRYAAMALLARIYLYNADYANAEREASQVINNNSNYEIVPDLNAVFLADSREAIWQFDASNGGIPYLVNYFVPTAGFEPQFIITPGLLNTFEAGDSRKSDWIGTSAGLSYPAKYFALSADVQYEVVLRLAEQYLIRAEARAQQNNISGAREDLDVIRNRAGLANTTANTKADLLSAIEQERRIELFCEWGNRFFDLKRTGRINTVIGTEKPGMWKSSAANYPIPANEITNNRNLVQNPGY